MKPFELTRADDPTRKPLLPQRRRRPRNREPTFASSPGARRSIDFMKLNVETPQKLIDVNHLPLGSIDNLPDGGLTIGATVRNSDLAIIRSVRKNYAVFPKLS